MIIEHRKKAYIFSAILIGAAIISMVFNMIVSGTGTLGLNLGAQFTGGTLMQMNIDEDFEMTEVRGVLAEHGLEDATLQQVRNRDDEGNLIVEGVMVQTGILDEDTRSNVINSFRENWTIPDEEMMIESTGAAIGEEQTRNSLIAVFVALIGMVIYIAVRFEINFALATIAALIHDLLIVLGVFSILQLEVNLPFVAALLAIVGYSINDSIVIMDRIRENTKYKRKSEYPDAVNTSILQNLTRSINTSLTTLMVLAALMVGFYVFVGSFDLVVFVTAMIIGVVVGTYSSIFVASPLWLTLKEREFRLAAKAKAKAR